MVNRKSVISEIDKELKMRKRVWAKIEGTQKFAKREHTERYELLAELGRMIHLMKDTEFNKFHQRLVRHKAAKGAQPKMKL